MDQSVVPREPEDIFSSVDRKEDGAVSDSRSSAGRLSSAVPQSERIDNHPALSPSTSVGHSARWMRIVLLVTAIIGIVIVGGLGIEMWKMKGGAIKNESTGAGIQPQQQAPDNTVSSSVPTTPMATVEHSSDQAASAPSAVDSDHDGLSDEEERRLGTDPHNPDTDGDGLTDGAEVHGWHTDPLKKDTDGDGYDDGYEVQHGYNPNGPGKLFDFIRDFKKLKSNN